MTDQQRRGSGAVRSLWHGTRAAWGLMLVTLVGGVIRFVGLGRQDLWLDETVTASLLDRSLGDMLSALESSESTPPLYYVLAWAWARVVGLEPTAIRSLSALVGTLTIPVVYVAGTTLVSRRAGFAAAALAAVSPLLVWYSQEARSYALLTLLTALSFAFFARAIARRSTHAFVGWAASSALALATHYFAVFLIAAEAVALLWLIPRRRATLVGASAVGATGLLLAPLVLGQASGSATWVREVDLARRVGESLRQLIIPSFPPIWAGTNVPETAYAGLWPVAVGVLAVAVGIAVVLGRGRERRGVLLALAIGGIAVLGPLALAVAGQVVADGRGDFVLYRNFLPAWLPMAVVVAGGLCVRRTGVLGVVGVLAIVAGSCVVLALMSSEERFERDDWSAVRETLGQRSVVVLSPSWQVDALTYHVRGVVPVPDHGVSTDEIDVVVRRRAPSYSTLVGSYSPPAGFVRVSSVRVQHWDVVRYRAPTAVRLRLEQLKDAHPEDASKIVLFRER